MGTRGVVGFHRDGVDKITYNHFDSYPAGLGEIVKTFLLETPVDQLHTIFDRIVMVDERATPTQDQIAECRNYLHNVKYEAVDWYEALHDAQGNLVVYRDGLRYMIDGKAFLQDSLYCEWGYVINLDTNMLEIYRGFQRSPSWNRYYSPTPTDGQGIYYNCQMIHAVSLFDLHAFDMAGFENRVNRDENSALYHQTIMKTFRRHIDQSCTYSTSHQVNDTSIVFNVMVMMQRPTLSLSVQTDILIDLQERLVCETVTMTSAPGAPTNEEGGWAYAVPVTITIGSNDQETT